MLPPEEQVAAEGVISSDFSEDLNPKFTPSKSVNLLKTLDFQFTKPSVLEKVEERDECESSEKFGSTLHTSANSTDFETSEERSDQEGFPVEEKSDNKIGNMNPTPTASQFDSNLTSNNSESEEVGSALKALENGSSPEPAESIVRANFVDFSPEEVCNSGEEASTELGKEFSLTLNPDLPKIRAQQIQNWLEFEKDEAEQGVAGVKNKASANEALEIEAGLSDHSSREESPPHDFELDSLTMMGGAVGGGASAGGSKEGVGDHTVTDADGLQRRVRFLTDTQGNILISVFLTNLDGEEEEQQQVIHFGAEPGHTLIPDGMNLDNFPEIESQLAAFVSHTQQLQQNKTDLVDTDQILKELGVEKDDEQGTGKVQSENVDGVGEDPGEMPEGDEKTLIPVDTSLSVYDEGDDGGGSDTETMSTSSCSSMIEVKPKTDEIEDGSSKKFRAKLDENNNEIPEGDEDLGSSVDVVEIKSSKDSKNDDISQTRPEISEYTPNGDLEPPKFTPKLVEIELKGTPNPPPAPISNNIPKPHPPSSVNLPFLVKNGEITHADEPCYNTSNENVVTVQVAGEPNSPYDYEPDQAEQQFESLCIEEEPISAVAVTIAKWENFSRKQQAAAESGESKVNIAVKGLGKLILPMYTPGQNNNQQQYVNTAPIKMGGPATPMKPMKQQQQGVGHHQQPNNNVANNGSGNKLWNGCGWGANGTGNLTNNHNTSPKILAQIEKVLPSSSSHEVEEETIYAQPNSQAGTLNMIVNSTNPSTLLRSYPKPNSRGEIINWFKEGEIHRSGILLSYGQSSTHHSTHIIPQPLTGPIVVSWFFGLINRQQAEELLLDQPCGTFLVRISTRVWGYTLSYQSNNKTKHFLISAINPAVAATLSAGPGGGGNGGDFKNGPLMPTGKQQLLFPFSPGGRYSFIGTNMTPYSTLTSLIRHHNHAPITKAGGEKLLYPMPGGPKIAGIEYVFK